MVLLRLGLIATLVALAQAACPNQCRYVIKNYKINLIRFFVLSFPNRCFS